MGFSSGLQHAQLGSYPVVCKTFPSNLYMLMGFRASIPAIIAKGNKVVAESGNTFKTTAEMAAAV